MVLKLAVLLVIFFNSIGGAGAGVDSGAGGGNRNNGGTVVVVSIRAFGGSVRTQSGRMQPSVGGSLITALEPLRRLAVPPLPMRGEIIDERDAFVLTIGGKR